MKFLRICVLLAALFGTAMQQAHACGGTSRPQCSRSVWLGLSVPNVIVSNPDGSATVNMTVLPYLWWDNVNCANPNDAELSLTLSYTSSEGGTATLDPVELTVPTPAAPGNQVLDGDVNTYTYTLPEGTFEANVSYTCQIEGTYTANFPASSVSGSSSTGACVVPPSPVDISKPGLNLRYISATPGQPFISSRRGDQAVMHFLIENNHPSQSITIDLTSTGTQLARLPDGVDAASAYNQGIHSISSPVEGTDVFPAAFAEDWTPGTLLPLGDPLAVDPQQLDKTITLAAGEARFVTFIVRSHGMCADGSCNRRDITLNGTWEDGSEVLGCASVLMVVNSVPPKTALWEYQDDIMTGPTTETQWRAATFDNAAGDLEHVNTFYAGTLPPDAPVAATELIGEEIVSSAQRPSSASDYVRTEVTATKVSYSVLSFAQSRDFSPFENTVTISNLDVVTTIEFPLILGPSDKATFDVRYDALADELEVWDTEENLRLYLGPYSEFLESPPLDMTVDMETSRTFTRSGSLTTPVIAAIPPTFSHLFARTQQIAGRDTAEIVDATSGLSGLFDWGATTEGNGGIVLDALSGNGDIMFGYDLGDLQSFPETNLGWIVVTAGTTLNSPIRIPVAVRIKDLEDVLIEQVDFLEPVAQLNAAQALFTSTYFPDDNLRNLNVMARYTKDDVTTENWLVRNQPLPPFPEPQTTSYWADLTLLGVEPGDDVTEIEITISITDSVRTVAWEPDRWAPYPVGNVKYIIGNGSIDTEPLAIGFEPPVVPQFIEIPEIEWVYRGCTVPNIDLDSTANNPNSRPGYAGDKNACGPAAAANSLHWLEQTHPNIDSTSTHRQKLEELSELMQRTNNRGVLRENFIKAKVAFIDKHKLPIKVKFQGFKFDTNNIASPDTNYNHSAANKNDSNRQKPNWDFLMHEMETEEDVELEFGYYDSEGRRRGGHWITVTGVSNIGGARGLYFKDDKRQDSAGGMRHNYVNWDTTSSGWPYLTGISSSRYRCFVESIVSESYDSTVRYDIAQPVMEQLNFSEPFVRPNSNVMLFTTSTTDETPRLGVVNVVAKTPDGNEDRWIVQNMMLHTTGRKEMTTYWVDLGLLGMQSGERLDSLELAISVGETIWTGMQTPDIWEVLPVYHSPYIVGYDGAMDIDLVPVPLEPFVFPSDLVYSVPATVDSVYRGCEIPNLDLDSSRNNPTSIPGYAGDKNACGPAGAANSLQWLENKYEQINTNSTHRKKLDELSKLMERENNMGVLTRNFVRGKLAYIDRHKLPIHVKYQSRWISDDSVKSPDTTGGGGYGHHAYDSLSGASEPTWEFFMNEMKRGEDVELIVQWTDSLGNNAGAHVICASGVSTAAGPKRFWYKDDQNQRDTGGTRQSQVTWDTANGRPYIREMSWNDTLCYVTGVISESYDETVKYDTTISLPSGVPYSGPEGLNGISLSVLNNPTAHGEISEILLTFNRSTHGSVTVYDMLGRETIKLADRHFEPGEYRFEWDGQDASGKHVAAGYYLLVFQSENGQSTDAIIRR